MWSVCVAGGAGACTCCGVVAVCVVLPGVTLYRCGVAGGELLCDVRRQEPYPDERARWLRLVGVGGLG